MGLIMDFLVGSDMDFFKDYFWMECYIILEYFFFFIIL